MQSLSMVLGKYKLQSRPLPVYDQLRPRPILFLELLNILGIKHYA